MMIKQAVKGFLSLWLVAVLMLAGSGVLVLMQEPVQAAASNPLPSVPILSGVKFRPNGSPANTSAEYSVLTGQPHISQPSYCSSSLSGFNNNYYADTVFGCGYNINGLNGSLSMASTIDPVAMYFRTESDYQHPVNILSNYSCYYTSSDPNKKIFTVNGCDIASLPMATNQWKNWVFVDNDNLVGTTHPSCIVVSNTATTITCATAISTASSGTSYYFDLYRRDVEYGIDFQVNNNRYSLFVADVNKSDSLSCNCLKQLDVGVIAPTADINSQGFTVRKSPGGANDVMFNAGEGNAKIWGASGFDTTLTLGSGANFNSAIFATGNGDKLAWSLFGQSYAGTFGVMTGTVYDQNGSNGRTLLSITNAGGTLDSTIGTASNGAIHLKANTVDVNGTDVTASSGSFAATITGFSAAPSATVTWSKIGKQACLSIGVITGTSNATTFTITNLPSALWPAMSVPLTYQGTDSGSVINTGTGYIIGGSGVISFVKSWAAQAWTASGTKGAAGVNQCYLTA